MADLGDALGRQIGPFNVGTWLAIGAGGVGLGLVIRRYADGLDKPAESEGTATEADPYRPVFGTQGAGVYTPLNGGAGNTMPGPGSETYETNDEWASAVVTMLTARNIQPTVVDAAVRKYLLGEMLTTQEGAAIDMALRLVGPPPEGVPPVRISPPSQVPGTPKPQPTPPPPTDKPVEPTPREAARAQGFNPREIAFFTYGDELVKKAAAGKKLSDAELDALRGFGFNTSGTGASAELPDEFRFYWRIWLDQRGFQGQNV